MAGAVVLAAGHGTRMRSELPKVLHQVAGRPMVEHVVRTAFDAGLAPVVVVVGYGSDAVRKALHGWDVTFAEQREQLGTGHAFQVALELVGPQLSTTFVLNGDGPLLRPSTLEGMQSAHLEQANGAGMVMATLDTEQPFGMGRVVRKHDGTVARIVEEKDATELERAITEVNPGIYLFDDQAHKRVASLQSDNAQSELYVTDLIGMYAAAQNPVLAVPLSDPSEGWAANDRAQLAVLEAEAQRRLRHAFMQQGVTMQQPETVWLSADVSLEEDVTLEPGVILKGATRVAAGATVGAGSVLDSCLVTPKTLVPPLTRASGATLTD